MILRRKYRKKSKELKQQQKLLKATADDMKLLSTAWNLNWADVKLEQLLASGAAGEVWKGTYCSRWKVAVKKMHNDDMELENDKEVNFLRRARHNRLVMMIGCGTFHPFHPYHHPYHLSHTKTKLYSHTHTQFSRFALE